MPPLLTVTVTDERKIPLDWLKVPVIETVPPVTATVPPDWLMVPDVTDKLPATVRLPPETVILAAAPVPVAPIVTDFAFAAPVVITG